MDWKQKICSRKFILALSAFLASLGTGIAGIVADNQVLAVTGGVLVVLSSSLYAFAEAWVDSKAVNKEEEK